MYIIKLKPLTVIYLIWVFLNLLLLSIGWDGKKHEDFFPFGTSQHHRLEYLNDVLTRDNAIDIPLLEQIKEHYNMTEFIVYSGTPLLIFLLIVSLTPINKLKRKNQSN
jgi:hypothetical protein